MRTLQLAVTYVAWQSFPPTLSDYLAAAPAPQDGDACLRRVVLVCASTGRAAYLVGGATIHACFRLPVTQYKGDLLPLSDDAANKMRRELREVRLVIVDEVSMVGATALEHIDSRLRQVFSRPSRPFGNLSVVLVGDLRQLPPVGDRQVFRAGAGRGCYDAILDGHLWRLFKHYELTDVERQRDDAEFAKALNALAEESRWPS